MGFAPAVEEARRLNWTEEDERSNEKVRPARAVLPPKKNPYLMVVDMAAYLTYMLF